MKQNTEQTHSTKVSTRLFIGFLITSELNMHLNQSIKWKHVNILATKDPADLTQVHYHGKDYIGHYADSETLTVSQLDALSASISKQIELYCPKMEMQKAQSIVFPQVFIA